MSITAAASASAVDDSQMGTWYNFTYQNNFEDSRYGIQGDWQYRVWDLQARDLQTLLIRNAVTYRPKDNWKVGIGYAHLVRGAFGDDPSSRVERRPYQEVSYSQQFDQFSLTHRVRAEQRWEDGNSFSTRYRYAITGKYYLNSQYYVTGYNEYFVDGGGNFDQNRTKVALGIHLTEQSKLHLGIMRQFDEDFEKNQLMVSWYYNF